MYELFATSNQVLESGNDNAEELDKVSVDDG
jgi:hypothetical protein